MNSIITNNINIVVWALFAVSILVLFSPFYLLSDRNSDSDMLTLPGSELTRTIQNSELLNLAHACCIAASLPMVFDTILDFYEKFMNISFGGPLTERGCFCVALILPSFVYLLCRTASIMPTMFIVLTELQSISIALLIWIGVLPEFARKSPNLLPVGSFLLVVMFIIRNFLRLFDALYDFPQSGRDFITVLTLLNYSLAFLGASLYFYRTLLISGSIFRISFQEYQCAVFLNAIFVYCLFTLILDNTNSVYSWKDADEGDLVTYAFVQLFVAVIITVLPGRLAKMNLLSLNAEILSLKRMFVRYVSHEIRSPLNVVHAGLDILLGELRLGMLWTSATLEAATELVEDIFSASDSAILILNDLLQYEHMDAGTFQLEKTWKSLVHLLTGKYNWAIFLAKRKGINFIIKDETVVTPEGVIASFSEREDEGSFKVKPGNLLSQSRVGNLILHIDEGKVDQVIRNLLTNAFKFTPAHGTITLRITTTFVEQYEPLPSSSAHGKMEKLQGVEAVLRVEVTDTGAGIAKENHDKVFGEFSQFNRNKLQGGGGSGLGLWISRRIIDMHDGHLSFYSAGEGFGSTFFFELPMFNAVTVGQEDSLTTSTPLPRKELVRQSFSSTLKPAEAIDLEIGSMNFGEVSTEHGLELESGFSNAGGDAHVPVHEVIAATLKAGKKKLRRKRHTDTVVDAKSSSIAHSHCLDSFSGVGLRVPQPIMIRSSWSKVSPDCSPSPKDVIVEEAEGDLEAEGGVEADSKDLKQASVVSSALGSADSDNSSDEGESSKPASKLNILVADDSALNRKMVIRLLQSDGRFSSASISEACDGEEVVQLVQSSLHSRREFDFILMDNVMLKLHGPQTAAILRKEFAYPGVILGITGNVHPEQIAEFLQHGANKVISKPLTRAKLLEAVLHFC